MAAYHAYSIAYSLYACFVTLRKLICRNSHFSIFGELVTDLKIIDYTFTHYISFFQTVHIFQILEILDVRNRWISVFLMNQSADCWVVFRIITDIWFITQAQSTTPFPKMFFFVQTFAAHKLSLYIWHNVQQENIISTTMATS